MPRKLAIGFVREQFEKEGYILLSLEYVNSSIKLDYTCSKGHKHSIKWNDWKTGYRCPYCAKRPPIKIKDVKSSFEEEGYTLLSKEYKNNHTKLKYICSEGHSASMTWANWGCGHRCPECAIINNSGRNSCLWKGGVRALNLPLYNTYAGQLNFAEEIRPYYDEENRKLLEARCSKCKKWFVPDWTVTQRRVGSLNGRTGGEHRFYCSQECKDSCEVFGKRAIDYLDLTQREDFYTDQELSIWSQEVLKRVNHLCEICGEPAEHAHHTQPKKLQPFLALDPDNGLALCKDCHYKYGHQNECSTGKLASTVCK